MEASIHTMTDLFRQLGLPGEPAAIDDFIARHGPLAHGLALHDAPFWTPAQAGFLKEEILEDADWAEVIDQLDARLRA